MEKEKMLVTSFSFSHNVSQFSSLISLTLSQTKPCFLCVCRASLLKTMWCGNRRNCSKRAIFPFYTASSTLLENFPQFPQFHQIYNRLLPTLSVWKSPKFIVWERVTNCDCVTPQGSIFHT